MASTKQKNIKVSRTSLHLSQTRPNGSDNSNNNATMEVENNYFIKKKKKTQMNQVNKVVSSHVNSRHDPKLLQAGGRERRKRVCRLFTSTLAPRAQIPPVSNQLQRSNSTAHCELLPPPHRKADTMLVSAKPKVPFLKH